VTDLSIALVDLLRKHQDDPQWDLLREFVRMMAQALMELEVSQQVGAGPYERSQPRKTYRNGYRERDWDTRVGTIRLRIPKLRTGSYFPSLLERRRRAEKALLAVIQEAYVEGVSTRKVDELVKALGMEGLSKSQVSRICQEIDEQLRPFRERELVGEYPYLWLDAKVVKVRQDGRVVAMAAVVAIGVRETGEREVVGYAIGPAESYEFWCAFLRELVRRGLKGVKLVISDAHEGLKRAIAEILAGVSWQRCRVHFLRNLLAHVPKHAQAMVAALVRIGPGQRAAGEGGADFAAALSQGGAAAAGGRRRRVDVHELSAGALAADSLHQPLGAAASGAGPAGGCSGHLPQPGVGAAAAGGGVGGAA
jgi:transposase-like protein